MAGLQCPKNLFLQVYHKKLAAPITPQEQMIFDQGNLVGELAQKEFETINKPGALVNTAYWDFKGALKKTEEFVFQGKENIFEASFSYEGVFARVDILQKLKPEEVGDNQKEDVWNLIEVKSGTKVKEENIKDVALQLWILENLGYKIQDCYLMHINNQCVFPDMSNFFHKENITVKAKEIKAVIGEKALELKKMVEAQVMPVKDIGPHCNAPYECKFKAYCGKDLSKQSIFLLPSMAGNDFAEGSWKKKLWDFYSQSILEIKDIPEEVLSPKQKIGQKVHLTGQSYINSQAISLDLKKWQQPLHYLSFNTINPAVPLWEGVRPYQQVIFQYNYAYQESIESEIIYKNYLDYDGVDPRLALTEQLVKDISEKGSIVSCHKAFDGYKVKVLANLYPHLKKPLLSIASRLVEPLKVLINHVYLKSFGPKRDLKFIALALFGKDASYKDFPVKDDALAQMAYKRVVKLLEEGSVSSLEKDQLRQYGKQDVFVLVKLVEWLYKYSKK